LINEKETVRKKVRGGERRETESWRRNRKICREGIDGGTWRKERDREIERDRDS
jgi:hypothetical protein